MTRRFAEKLLFALFDPKVDVVIGAEDEDSLSDNENAAAADKREKADAEDRGPLYNCYKNVYLSVEEGLRSYARTLEILNISKGIESPWEVQFSPTFL